MMEIFFLFSVFDIKLLVVWLGEKVDERKNWRGML